MLDESEYPEIDEILPFFDLATKVKFRGLRKDTGRYTVQYYGEGDKYKQSTYARYLMENHLGRYLNSNEIVDHIDRNKTNDRLSNLRVVSRSKSTKEDIKRVDLIEIKCVWYLCDKTAFRPARALNHAAKQGKAGPFCSKSCAGKYGAAVQNGMPPYARQEDFPIENRNYYFLTKKD